MIETEHMSDQLTDKYLEHMVELTKECGSSAFREAGAAPWGALIQGRFRSSSCFKLS